MSEAGPAVLAVDLGTTALKAALYAVDGRQLGSASREYTLSTPTPQMVEVDPQTYWLAFVDATRELLARTGLPGSQVAGIGVSAQGETLVVADAAGSPLRDAIVWLDNRAGEESAELHARLGSEVYEVTGQPEMLPAWPAAKILWLARHEPGTTARARRYLLLEDWFIGRLTGEFVCEGSLVTSTCYWDFRRKTWWADMLDAIEVDASQLPTLVEPGTAVGPLTASAARELGLTTATVVCTGALDQACGAIGVGNVRSGGFSENTGAAVALCATIDGPRLDPRREMPCHYHGMPDTYMFHSFTGGGIVLKWWRDAFATAERAEAERTGADAYDVLGRAAAAIPPGSEGLVMLPHLQGAMAPENDPDARGVLLGLTLRHGPAHVTRAVMESIAFVVRRNIEVLEGLGVRITEIKALGGGARSRVWKQIEADVTGRPVSVTAESDAATLGAAVLTGVGLGWHDSVVAATREMVHVRSTFDPDPAATAVYDEHYGVYQHAYEALKPVFRRMATISPPEASVEAVGSQPAVV